MWWCDGGRRRAAARRCLAAGVALALAGCGFHLRGSGPGERLNVRDLFVDEGPVSGTLAAVVRRDLVQAGAALAPDREAAAVIVHLTGETQTKQVLSVGGTSGRVQDYELRYTLGYAVSDGGGKVLIPPQQIVLLRTLTFNVNDVLAKGNEEGHLFRSMRAEALSQLIRRLVSTLSK